MILPARTSASKASISNAPARSATSAAGSADRRLVAGLGVAGGALAIIGSLLPWVSLYAGLQTIAGTDGLNGRILAGLGGVAVLAAVAHAIRGGQGSRWLLGIAGFAVLVLAGWLGIQLLQTGAVLAADPLLVSHVEPGLVVSLVGGSLVLATLFAPDKSRADLGEPTTPMRRTAAQVALAAVLAVAGIVHLGLVSEHLEESIALGVGFLGVGLGQVILAGMLFRSRSRTSLWLALLLSVFSLAALGAAVTIGLPAFLHGPMAEALGPVESLSDLGIITGLAELIAVALAVRLLRTARP
ncbi:MAG TPA: hypothetical protein VM427_10045 [Patescibacteria group bacterium]|nr:hypothetical protein [Patescibacteria group bacterium]